MADAEQVPVTVLDDRDERIIRIEEKLDSLLEKIQHGDDIVKQMVTYLAERHNALTVKVEENRSMITTVQADQAAIERRNAKQDGMFSGISTTTKSLVGFFSFSMLILNIIIAISVLRG